MNVLINFQCQGTKRDLGSLSDFPIIINIKLIKLMCLWQNAVLRHVLKLPYTLTFNAIDTLRSFLIEMQTVIVERS